MAIALHFYFFPLHRKRIRFLNYENFVNFQCILQLELVKDLLEFLFNMGIRSRTLKYIPYVVFLGFGYLLVIIEIDNFHGRIVSSFQLHQDPLMSINLIWFDMLCETYFIIPNPYDQPFYLFLSNLVILKDLLQIILQFLFHLNLVYQLYHSSGYIH